MYSASMDDAAAVVISFEPHDSGPPAAILAYPDVDRRVCRSLSQSESDRPCKSNKNSKRADNIVPAAY